jgi:hypothetical protein
MNDSMKKILIPSSWIGHPKINTLSDLKLSRRQLITGLGQDINKKSDRFLQDIENDRQDKRFKQGLSLTPQDFPKRAVEYKYSSNPQGSYQTSPSPRLDPSELNEKHLKSKSQERKDSRLLILPKISKEGGRNSSFFKELPGFPCRRIVPNETSITPKPNEVRFEDYSNKFIFAKSKPVFRKKLNFLDIFENDSKNINNWRNEDSDLRFLRDKSQKITNRLRHNFKRSTSRVLTSGFNVL